MVKPTPQCNGICWWGLWEVLGHEREALMNEISVLAEGTLQSPQSHVQWEHT